MSYNLRGGGRRPVIDVKSDNLVFIWNLPKWLNVGDIKSSLQPRYGRIKFVETFEAWKEGKKIGQIIIDFATASSLDSFIEALSKKKEFDYNGVEFMRLDLKVGSRRFFAFVKEKSDVDLLECDGVPPTFDYKHKFHPNSNTDFNAPRPPPRGRGGFPPTLSQFMPPRTDNNTFASSPAPPSDGFTSTSYKPRGRGGRGYPSFNSGRFASSRNEEEEGDGQRKSNAEQQQQFNFSSPSDESGSFGSRPSRFGGRGRGGRSMQAFMQKDNDDVGKENRDNETSEVVKQQPMEDGNNNDIMQQSESDDTTVGTDDFPNVDEQDNVYTEEDAEVDEAFGRDESKTPTNGSGEGRPDSGQGTSPASPSPTPSTNDNPSMMSKVRNINESPQFTQYRVKSRSGFSDSQGSSTAGECRVPKNTLKITKLEPGFNLLKILEALQCFGDVVHSARMDRTTAVFTFGDAADAANASVFVNAELVGPAAQFEVVVGGDGASGHNVV